MSALCALLWVLLGWTEFWAWQPFVCVGNRSDQAGVGQECLVLWKKQPRSVQPLGFLSVPVQWHGSAMGAPGYIYPKPGRKGTPTVIKHQGRRT